MTWVEEYHMLTIFGKMHNVAGFVLTNQLLTCHPMELWWRPVVIVLHTIRRVHTKFAFGFVHHDLSRTFIIHDK